MRETVKDSGRGERRIRPPCEQLESIRYYYRGKRRVPRSHWRMCPVRENLRKLENEDCRVRSKINKICRLLCNPFVPMLTTLPPCFSSLIDCVEKKSGTRRLDAKVVVSSYSFDFDY